MTDLSCVETRCCSSLHKQHFFVLQKRHFERRIISKHDFIGLMDLHAELPGLTMLDFFYLSYLDDKVWNYIPQSTCSQLMWLRLGLLLQVWRRSTRLMIQNDFYFTKDGCRKCISVNGHYSDNEFDANNFKQTRIRDKQFLCENMIVVYVVPD